MNGVRALVTGGASGIGEAAAALLLRRGARVAVLDRDVAGVEPPAIAVQADVTDDAAVRAAVASAAERSAGSTSSSTTPASARRARSRTTPTRSGAHVFDVNVLGIARVARGSPAVPAASPTDAAIVNTSSIAATAGLPQRALYSATKGAILSLTLAMAADHVRRGHPRQLRATRGRPTRRGSAGCSPPPTIPPPSARRSRRASRWAGWSRRPRSREAIAYLVSPRGRVDHRHRARRRRRDAGAPAAPEVVIVDAHHHLWDPGRRDYPWMTGDLEVLRRPRGLDDLLAVAGPAGVRATVVVQATSSEEETADLLRQAAASDGLVAAVVGWVDLTAPDVAERIDALRAGEGGERLAGIRHQVQDEPDPEWLRARRRAARARGGRRRRPRLRPPRCCRPTCPPRGASRRTSTGSRWCVDHGAKPPIAAGGWEPWSSDLAALAAHERVHCKLSGLVTEAPWDDWRGAGIERYATRLLELFGPARLMFGSDWPVCTLAASYAEVLDLARGRWRAWATASATRSSPGPRGGSTA